MPNTEKKHFDAIQAEFSAQTSGMGYFFSKIFQDNSDFKVANELIKKHVLENPSFAMAKATNQFINAFNKAHPDSKIVYKLAIDEVGNIFMHDDSKPSGSQYVKLHMQSTNGHQVAGLLNNYSPQKIKNLTSTYLSDGVLSAEEKLDLAVIAYYNKSTDISVFESLGKVLIYPKTAAKNSGTNNNLFSQYSGHDDVTEFNIPKTEKPKITR